MDFRPHAHFTAEDTWLNDPNGLLFHDGRWHLFFQNNPEGPDWGNMSWGHASSADLVHWDRLPLAIPHEGPEAIFSGSAVVDGSRIAAIYTSAYDDGRQAQSLAWSSDGVTFTKEASNPVLDRASTGFRDPKVFRYDDHWVMVAVEADERLVVLYRSEDLLDWEFLSSFDDGTTTGIWECPDLFPLPLDGDDSGDPDDVRWVLLLSVNGPDGSDVVYRVGSFDGVHLDVGPPRSLDAGPDVYAAATWTDAPDGRRVLLGWMADPDYAGSTPTAPWRGAMTLPRELSLCTVDGSPTLRQRVPEEVTGRLVHEVGDLPGTDCVVVCRFAGDASWEFSAGEAVLRVAVEGHELVVDRRTSGLVDFHPSFPRVTRSPLPPGTAELTVHLDRCSVEVFAGGTSSTHLVFPTEPYREITGTAGFRVLVPTPQEETP
ncbi:glycoside hydrolase family 32 protein [Kineococcus sp. R86509]|uniref:glycoside hydrolase family 32 protein n=1 Tax=Kineococcus sp. R86509 TaxID=3093851 RepID=UPI0036D40609